MWVIPTAVYKSFVPVKHTPLLAAHISRSEICAFLSSSILFKDVHVNAIKDLDKINKAQETWDEDGTMIAMRIARLLLQQREEHVAIIKSVVGDGFKT